MQYNQRKQKLAPLLIPPRKSKSHLQTISHHFYSDKPQHFKEARRSRVFIKLANVRMKKIKIYDHKLQKFALSFLSFVSND
jgi:hypothetical protein